MTILTPINSSSRNWSTFELPEDLPCDVAFEAAPNLSIGFAFLPPPLGVGAGVVIVPETVYDDHVQRPVELPVSASG
jgi:hypothetical protein